VRDKSVTWNDHVSGSSASPHTTVTIPDVPHGRLHHHVYPCTSSGGKDEVLATVSADIRNYTEPGEDLDWTKVSDPTERKRLQGVIGGRKYRERRLAAQGKGGSGGNYPGASGVGSYISNGYGPQRPYGYSTSRSPRALSTDPASAESKNISTSTPGKSIKP
jgi:chromatin structure-remodeling complex subunit SFH1